MFKSEKSIETFWIPTPQEPCYETQHTPKAAKRPERYKTETNPTVGVLFLQGTGTFLEMPNGEPNFPFFSMQRKHADNTYGSINELY